MRFPAFFLLVAGLIFTPGCASRVPTGTPSAPARIVRIQPGYRTTASFQRVSEFLTGRENTGNETVLRSQPGVRDGYYWFLRLENSGAAIAEATFELKVITPTNPDPATFTFRAAVPVGTHVFNVGLTGADWPNPDAAPVAWQLRLVTPGGELVSTQSFLWSKPAAPAAK